MFAPTLASRIACWSSLLPLSLIVCYLQGQTEQPAPTPASPPTRTDRHGDPLPDGAIARLGTVRWRHGFLVQALAYSPDGSTIVTAGAGRALVLWDAATGKELRVFQKHGHPRGAVFSPDGKRIASTLGTGQLWDVATGKLLRELNNSPLDTNALAFAPNGEILATANSDGAVYLWDSVSGDKKHRIDCEQGRLRVVAFAPDGKLLATGGSDGTIRLWDTATYKEVRRVKTPKKEIWSLVFSSDGKQLACGSNEDSPRLWDVATGREVRTFGDKQGIFAPLALSPDGKLLASGYDDGSFRLWDVASGVEKRHWRGGNENARCLAFSPDGKTLATAVFWGSSIRLWDVATGRERFPSEGHRGPISLLRFSPDQAALTSVGHDQYLRVWDLASQTPRFQLTWPTDNFLSAALSPDGNTLATGIHETNEVWLWDVRTSKVTKLPGLSGKNVHQAQSVVFSPDGRLVAAGGYDKAIHIWDVRQVKEVQKIKGVSEPNRMRLRFTPDGKTLACGIIDFRPSVVLHLWDVASGKELRVFGNRGGVGISPDAFSPDGKVLATANDPPGTNLGLVRLLDMTTGKELCRHTGHGDVFGIVAFSPDGKLVVSQEKKDEVSSVHVWEAATGRLIRHFEGHHGTIWSVAFAPDGLTVASGGGDSTVLLWDITGRRQDGKLRSAALTPPQLEACWTALADADAAKAYDAVWTLVAAPDQAVPFLQKHLLPVRLPNAKAVALLIADFDSTDFTARRRATEELSKLGDAIVPILRHALASKPSLEVRRRIQQLLDQTRDWTAERLRDHRAIQALEHIGTQSAREVLQALAGGAPESQRTEEAKAALHR